ncbi:MAG: hypothetical protein KGH67_02275 [Candidatus Micrarchaeota archaeon]|nr:hypothetical protein [Candidatus Micrarchaeota archaeon]MDE1859330.1 hypothetical protein [Candidatus Micrarchaeota archaeon]
MNRIILDTSSILFALSNKIDLFKKVEEQLSYEPVVSAGVIKELSKMAESRQKNSKYASVALLLIKRYNVKVENNDDYVDRWILSSAKAFQNVCTNDIKLKRQLSSQGVNTYSISRGGSLR